MKNKAGIIRTRSDAPDRYQIEKTLGNNVAIFGAIADLAHKRKGGYTIAACMAELSV